MEAKTALITGASSDIGRAVAVELAASGFNIAAHYLNNRAAAQDIREQIAGWGVRASLFRYDLMHVNHAKDLVDAVVSDFGRIDVLVNTIGPFYHRDILDVTPQEWAEAIQLNLNVAFNVTYFAKEPLCATKGHVINFGFSGVQSMKAWPTSAGYCAAKAGLVVLTKSLAASYAPLGVRVNAVCPGLVEAGPIDEQERQEMARQIPLGRPGRPKEVAEIVRWLVVESPTYVTGALVPVSGGWEY